MGVVIMRSLIVNILQASVPVLQPHPFPLALALKRLYRCLRAVNQRREIRHRRLAAFASQKL